MRMHNANVNDECEWRMWSGDQCSFPSVQHMLPLQRLCVWAVSHPIKHSHSNRSLHSDSFCCIHSSHLHSDMWKHSYTNSMFLIFVVVAFTFLIRICIMHKWNRSCTVEAFAVWAIFYSNQWSTTGPPNAVVYAVVYELWYELWENAYKRSLAGMGCQGSYRFKYRVRYCQTVIYFLHWWY